MERLSSPELVPTGQVAGLLAPDHPSLPGPERDLAHLLGQGGRPDSRPGEGGSWRVV